MVAVVTLHVYIGFDERQPVAFQTLAHSIWKQSTKPVSITRLVLDTLPIKRRGLTQFTYSRFLVPWLSGYQGTSMFLDSDMLAVGDIAPLFDFAMENDHPVFVVKNKLRFEWPSLMIFKGWNCKTLTPEYVDNPAHKLFDFAWASSVGELSPQWNHLVGYDAPQDAKIIHYTKGIPIWAETRDCEYAKEWHDARRETQFSVSYDELMGSSVHARK